MPELKNLSTRLLVWQVLLSVTLLTSMCTVVYLFLAEQLAAKQSAVILQNVAIVEHLVAEADQLGSTAELVHKLTDLVSVKTELGISIRATQGGPSFDKPLKAQEQAPIKMHQFDLITRRWGSLGGEVSLDTSSDQKLKSQFAWLLIALSGLGSMIVAWVGFLISRSGLKPLQQLTQQIQALAVTDLGARLDGSNQPQEVQGLVTQFNNLLVRLQRSYEQLENFNANVAHELKNPIANLIAAHELLLRKRCTGSESGDFYASNLEELLRISGIVNDMLFLARADGGTQARLQRVESVALLTQKVAEYYEASAEESEVSLSLSGNAQANLDPGLFKRAVSNLLSNAIRYADRQSTIQIKIENDDTWTRVSVINSGMPISANELARVFERFYRGSLARENSQSQHGLGLSIVSAIAKMHGGVAYAQANERIVEVGFKWPSSF